MTKDWGRDVACHIECIRPFSANDRCHRIKRRAQQEELIIAFQSIQFIALFRIADLHIEPRAKDPISSDHEGIIQLSPQYDDSIKSLASVNRDGSIDIVLNKVIPCTRIDLG